MNDCVHAVLWLLPPPPPKLRCRHCDLRISEDELAGGACPECLEATGRRRREFEPVTPDERDGARYRCEACGLLVRC